MLCNVVNVAVIVNVAVNVVNVAVNVVNVAVIVMNIFLFLTIKFCLQLLWFIERLQ